MAKLKDKLFEQRRAIDADRAQIEKEFSIVFGDIFLGVNEGAGLNIELPLKKTLVTDDDAVKLAEWILRLFKDDKPNRPEDPKPEDSKPEDPKP